MSVDPCQEPPPVYKGTEAFHDLSGTEQKNVPAQSFVQRWMAGKEKLKGVARQLSFAFLFNFCFPGPKH